MNPLLDSDLESAPPSTDREISLGVGTILAIFFGLALLCAVFFGFGYGVGRRSSQTTAAAQTTDQPVVVVSSSKPAAGSPAGRSSAKQQPPETTDPLPAARSDSKAASPSDTIIVGDKLPTATAAATTATANGTTGSFMVQVAAVSSQDIADIELSALKKYGYQVVVRHEPQDQLLHVQIGPFSNRKDAEAMRQNVLSHGFNAIVK